MDELNKQVDYLRTEDLIREVEKFPAIWDSTQDEYINRLVRDKAWLCIISKFFPDIEEKTPVDRHFIEGAFRKRWKSIRTCYSRELLKMKTLKGPAHSGRRQYQHYEILRFLDGPAKTPSTLSQEEKDSTKTPSSSDQTESTTRSTRQSSKAQSPPTPVKGKRKVPPPIKTFPKKKIKPDENRNPVKKGTMEVYLAEKKIMEDNKEADRLFLLSLVSDFQNVPQSRKLQLKSDILNAILEAQAPLEPCPEFQFSEVWQNHGDNTEDKTQQNDRECGTSLDFSQNSQDQSFVGSQRPQENDISSHQEESGGDIMKPQFVKVEPGECYSSADERDSAGSDEEEEIFTFT